MKRFILMSTIVLWCGAAIAQEKKVAVFDPAGDVTSSIKEIVREEISNIIVNIEGYTVLERQLINKVMEENQFQMGGLVDDAQISAIGKRMGANYVLVSSITLLNSNYHISGKMIEVQTAHVEKQKTAQTKRGTADIVEVTQNMMKSMFGLEAGFFEKLFKKPVKKQETKKEIGEQANANPEKDSAEQKAKEEKVKEETEKQAKIETEKQAKIEMEREAKAKAEAEKLSPAIVVADGMKVYSNGKTLLKKNEVRTMMINTDALAYYNKGLQRAKRGSVSLAIGIVSLCGGVGSLVSGGLIFYGDDEALFFYIGGGIVTGIGLGLIIAGPVLRSKAKKDVSQAVNMYNGRQSTSHVEFGFKAMPNGLSFTVKF
jgi:hypothetical protein